MLVSGDMNVTGLGGDLQRRWRVLSLDIRLGMGPVKPMRGLSADGTFAIPAEQNRQRD